jgi:hypothetical protein
MRCTPPSAVLLLLLLLVVMVVRLVVAVVVGVVLLLLLLPLPLLLVQADITVRRVTAFRTLRVCNRPGHHPGLLLLLGALTGANDSLGEVEHAWPESGVVY